MHRRRRQQLLGRLSRQVRRDAAGPLERHAPNGCPTAAAGTTIRFASTGTERDATSGGVSCSSLTYAGPDDANASKSGGCTDAAGNSSGNSLSFGLRYDSTPPATLGTPSPAPNAKGWLRSPVTVAWSGSDTTSGIASCSAPSGYSGPDTAAATLGGSCTDNAGNSSNGSYTVKYDTHPPATTAAPTRAPNASWLVPHARDDLGQRHRRALRRRLLWLDHLRRPRHRGAEHERDVHRRRGQQLLGRLSREVRRDAAGPLERHRRTGARQRRLVQPSGSHRLARNRPHLGRRLVLVAHLCRPGRRECVHVGRLHGRRREQQRQLPLLRAPV